MSDIIIPPVNAHFESILKGEPERSTGWAEFDAELPDRWHFGAGDPEYWKFHDVMVTPGGRVLDIGIGTGRGSVYFAMHGMSVTGFDPNPNGVKTVNDMVAEMGDALPGHMEAFPFEAKDSPESLLGFDLAVLGYLNHLPSKAKSFELINLAYAALRPGGHIWFRAIGKNSSAYEEIMEATYYDPNVTYVNDDVIEHPCSCSGELKIEPSIFLDPGETLNYFAQLGANFVHTRTLSTKGVWNMLHGQDFNSESYTELGGMITILAQKPPANPGQGASH